MNVTATTFAELGISTEIVEALERRGVTEPFPIQNAVMGDALAGRDVLAKAPTGSGKTLAFSIPIAETVEPDDPVPSALVLVPTRELAQQVALESRDVAEAKGLKVAAVYGGIEISRQKAGREANILIATPGRLNDLARRKMISLRHVRILVLDEADRMLDMGFQPQVDSIVRLVPEDRQTMFFSATLDGVVGRLAKAYTRDAAAHEPSEGIELADNRTHRFLPVTHGTKFKTLVDLLAGERELALVFVAMKNDVDRLAYDLKVAGVNAASMHGDLPQQQREKTLARFDRGEVTTLVATDVAARGLDLDKITHVINYDPPNTTNEYVHRVGRTARAGRSGTAITLVLPEQRGGIGKMAGALGHKDEFAESAGKPISPAAAAWAARRRGRRR